MVTKILQLILVTGFFSFGGIAQTITPEQYIEQYKDIAIREMKRMGVPAAITLAQGLLETESGNSELVKKSNNHFGIKCKSNWTAGGVSHDDDALGECFRTYKTAEDSYRDHSNFLRGSERYAFMFELSPTDYKGWAYGLRKAGYATNPKYPNILIKNIEKYNLQQYSMAGAAEVPKFESNKYKDDPVVFEKEQEIQIDQSDKSGASLKAENQPDERQLVQAFNSDQVKYINGNKCIKAKKGTSLLAIAISFDLNLQKLLNMNELLKDGLLQKDQLIFLQKKSKNGEKDFIILQPQESLYDVAQNNGILLTSLLEYNQLNEADLLAPGTKLYLKAISESDQARVILDNASGTKEIVYAVQAKEGLYTVAKKHSVTVQQLKAWNNLTTDDLKIGQQLIVGK